MVAGGRKTAVRSNATRLKMGRSEPASEAALDATATLAEATLGTMGSASMLSASVATARATASSLCARSARRCGADGAGTSRARLIRKLGSRRACHPRFMKTYAGRWGWAWMQLAMRLASSQIFLQILTL